MERRRAALHHRHGRPSRAGSARRPVLRATVRPARCPYLRDVFENFPCPPNSTRLLRAHAASRIAGHTDNALDFDEGEIRFLHDNEASDGAAVDLDHAIPRVTRVLHPPAVSGVGCVVVFDDRLRELLRRLALDPVPQAEVRGIDVHAHFAEEGLVLGADGAPLDERLHGRRRDFLPRVAPRLVAVTTPPSNFACIFRPGRQLPFRPYDATR